MPKIRVLEKDISVIKIQEFNDMEEIEQIRNNQGYRNNTTDNEKPSEWNVEIILPKYNKGNKSVCDNHTGILLISVAANGSTGRIQI